MGNSPLAVIEWDSQHHITTWTGNAPRMFGWTAAEVIGKRADEWRFAYEEDLDVVRESMAAMDRGESCFSRNRNYRKDGTVVHCEWYNSVLTDEEGAFLHGLSLVLDVTEREHMEDALRVSEQRYRRLFDLAPTGIFRSTVAGRFLSVNARLARMFAHRSPEEMVAATGNIAEQLFVDPAQRVELLQRALASEDFVSGEVTYRRRDGTTFLADLYLRAVPDETNRTPCLEGFVEDITERRRAEESLRGSYDAMEQRVRERTAELSAANERLQEVDRLKSQFLASMSHELRTPMNSIVGFTSLLCQGLTGPINAEQKKQLEIVQSSAKHLLTLINDLLDVSRIEAGRADLEHKPFEFDDVLREVILSLTPMADRKGLAMTAELERPHILMSGDRKRTLQVLLNLVNNAIKFTAKGSVRVRARIEGEMLRVAVADTGIGMKEEHTGMVFEAFRQVDGSGKRIYEGTGLGLYLCRKLLGMMGGTIRVESVFGEGSTFIYEMPLRLPEESEESSCP